MGKQKIYEKDIRKRTGVLAVLFFMLFTMVHGAFAAGENVNVYVNGRTEAYPLVRVSVDGSAIAGDMPAILYGSTTMAPVRFITEGMGGTVKWDEKKKEVLVKTSKKVLSLRIGSGEIVVDGVRKRIPNGGVPVLMNGRTMLPLRYIAETLGAEVGWVNETRTATVKTKEPEVNPSESVGLNAVKYIARTKIAEEDIIEIGMDRLAKYTHYRLKDPERVVIDIEGTVLSEKDKVYALSNDIVEKVRTGTQPGNKARVVIDIKEDIEDLEYSIKEAGGRLLFYSSGSNVEKAPIEQTPIPEQTPKPPAEDSQPSRPPEGSGTSVVKGFSKAAVKGESVIEIDTSETPQYTYYKLSNPERIVIDMENAVLSEGENTYSLSTDVVERVRTGVQPGNKVRVVMDIKKSVGVYEYSVVKSGNKIVVHTKAQSEAETPPATVPPYTVKKTIVIDPGHGGFDPGAVSYSKKYKESNLVLSVGLKLEKELKAKGYNVIMTRRTDTYLRLDERAAIANKANADAFISLHYNAAVYQDATGLETWYAGKTGVGVKTTDDLLFAKSIQDSLMKGVGGRDRGVKQEQFAVLRLTKRQAALVELGFLSNPKDETRIVTDAYHQQAAKAIAEGIERFFRK